MLHELRVENLLLMDRAELRLAPGLNVLTGETGAGKTLLAQALDLLLGGRAGSGIVRAGAAEAYVEGVFARPDSLDGEIAERIPEDAAEIVLARRVWPDGRTRAYVCGRSATVADLRELGGRLVAFYGQHEHRKLMLSTAQLDILDAHCGAEQLATRERVAATYERTRALERRVAELREMAGARERELDLLAFELDEIEAVAPGEEEAAAADRRARPATPPGDAPAGGSRPAPTRWRPTAEEGSRSCWRRPSPSSSRRPRSIPSWPRCRRGYKALRYEAEDLGRELRSYVAGLEGEIGGEAGGPDRLEQVEERLAQFARLQRKHGGSIAEVLAHADRCRERRAELEGAEVALEGGEAELDAGPRRAGPAGVRAARAPRGSRARARGRGPRRGWPSWRCPMRDSRSSFIRARTVAGRAARTRSS